MFVWFCNINHNCIQRNVITTLCCPTTRRPFLRAWSNNLRHPIRWQWPELDIQLERQLLPKRLLTKLQLESQWFCRQSTRWQPLSQLQPPILSSFPPRTTLNRTHNEIMRLIFTYKNPEKKHSTYIFTVFTI